MIRRRGWRHAIGIVAMVALGIATITWVVMQLWNGLLPELFGWRSIGFMQALGLLALSKILFGGWHRGGHGWHRHGAWAHLSDEEREKLRERFAHRCHGHEPSQKPDGAST